MLPTWSARAVPVRAVAAAIAAALTLLCPSAASSQSIRIDVGTGGAPGDGQSYLPVVSFDGRFTAFASSSSNLVAGDTDGSFDFFRYDRQTGELTRGNAEPLLTVGAYPSLMAISHDGRWLLFNDLRNDWVAGDTNGAFDVFLYDFVNGGVRRVSVASDGAQANGGSYALSMSLDGRYVAFQSEATNLGPASLDNGPLQDVFVHDVQTGQTVQVSRGLGGTPANAECYTARISPDGEWVAFVTPATNLTNEPDTNADWDTYLAHWPTGAMMRVAPLHVEPNQQTSPAALTWSATAVVVESRATNLVAGGTPLAWNTFVWDRLAGTMRRVSAPWPEESTSPSNFTAAKISVYGRYVTRVRPNPAFARTLVQTDMTSGQATVLATALDDGSDASGDGRVLVYGFDNGIYQIVINTPADGLLPNGDADTDGLSNDWERHFGLDPLFGSGDWGSDGDPDHDGHTNLQELIAGTHPRGAFTRHLAEGAQNAFFETTLALLNPGGAPASALVRFLRDDATSMTETVIIPGRTRRTINAAAVAGARNVSFSTMVESDAAVVVERTMRWDASAYGAHTEGSMSAPSHTWYLAEGATSGAFSLFYLLENPNATLTDATVRFIRPAPLAPIVHTYALPPMSRTTIAVDEADVGLAATDVAAAIDATQPILVERAMYWNRPELPFAAGHASAGVPAGASRWFLAEGATGSFFETFILLLNPSAQSAPCEVRYLTTAGVVYTKTYVLPPVSRTTIWADVEEIPGAGRALANASFSTVVTSTSNVPIVVERAMWWPDGDWQESHNAVGAAATSVRWAVADGEGAADRDAHTYVLVANTSPFGGDVRVTLLFDDGSTTQKTMAVHAESRMTIDLRSEFPVTAGRHFGVLIESADATPLALVVEHASYWNANGIFWSAGVAALAAPLPSR